MIDSKGYRSNIGIILFSRKGVFWGKRVKQKAWQFPQGGINDNESPTDAMFRELYEEVGVSKDKVRLVAQTKQWLRYKIPKKLQRDSIPKVIGQKQKWFLLELIGDDSDIRLDISKKPEFDDWNWVSYWFPLNQVINFKKEVYRKALRELSSYYFGVLLKNGRVRPFDPL